MKKILFCSYLFLCFLMPSFASAKGIVLKEKACEDKLIELINGAKEYIDISVYSINNERLVSAVINAHKKGVKIRVLTDKVQAAGKSSKVWDLLYAKIPLKVHTHKRIMHTKVAIYDGISVSSGSFNWTEPAVSKNEEVCDIFINDPDYTLQHQALFNHRWEKNSQEKSDAWLLKKAIERLEKSKETKK